MKNSVILAITSVLLISCSFAGGRVSNLRGEVANISRYDSQKAVLSRLGEPGDRSFSGNYEAWQYCETGFSSDVYATVWFENGVVTGVTTQDAYLVDGLCDQAFPRVDWR